MLKEERHTIFDAFRYHQRENTDSKLETIREYDELREYKLPETSYPMDVMIAARLDDVLDIRSKAVSESIPEFIKYNIREGNRNKSIKMEDLKNQG